MEGTWKFETKVQSPPIFRGQTSSAPNPQNPNVANCVPHFMLSIQGVPQIPMSSKMSSTLSNYVVQHPPYPIRMINQPRHLLCKFKFWMDNHLWNTTPKFHDNEHEAKLVASHQQFFFAQTFAVF
jgi:hypothetical protein